MGPWRIIPAGKWLVAPIYKPCRPFGRGPTTLGDEKKTMVINHCNKSWDDPNQVLTLHETNSSHLPGSYPKRKLKIFQSFIFRCYDMLVLGRVISCWPAGLDFCSAPSVLLLQRSSRFPPNNLFFLDKKKSRRMETKMGEEIPKKQK